MKTKKSERPRIVAKDVVLLIGLGIFIPLVGLLSIARLKQLARNITPLATRFAGSKTSADVIASALQIRSDEADAIAHSAITARIMSLLLFLKSRFYQYRFEITLEGEHHLHSALSRGTGVVLWVAELSYCPDRVKQALKEHGFEVSHLSRVEHGFSSSRFGIRCVNPLRTKYELKYLKQRIIVQHGQKENLQKQVAECLNCNEIVSILASAHVGKSPLKGQFLGNSFSLAGGAPSFAFTASSTLIPVSCTPDKNLQHYRVSIGEPLCLDGVDKRRAIGDAVQQYLDWLEPVVRKNPELFLQWSACEPRHPENLTGETTANEV